MCCENANSHEPVSIIDRVIGWMTVVSVALTILIVSSCATTMTETQQQAAWKILARDAAIAAMAFSPEAAASMKAVCVCVNVGDIYQGKEVLQQLWTELNDLQATAVVVLINDVVTLAGIDVNNLSSDSQAQKVWDILKAMCSVIPKSTQVQ